MQIELTGLAQTRLIIVTIVLALLGCWYLSSRAARRRLRDFAALARTFGVEAANEGEFLSKFQVGIDGRDIEVRYQHLNGQAGAINAWYLVTSIPLRGVSELHSIDIRLRNGRARPDSPPATEFQDDFSVRDADGSQVGRWLNERTRVAIHAFYAQDLSLGPISIEEGKLIHRSSGLPCSFSGGRLRELLERQSTIAAAIESAL
jgi:hypothetical protein